MDPLVSTAETIAKMLFGADVTPVEASEYIQKMDPGSSDMHVDRPIEEEETKGEVDDDEDAEATTRLTKSFRALVDTCVEKGLINEQGEFSDIISKAERIYNRDNTGKFSGSSGSSAAGFHFSHKTKAIAEFAGLGALAGSAAFLASRTPAAVHAAEDSIRVTHKLITHSDPAKRAIGYSMLRNTAKDVLQLGATAGGTALTAGGASTEGKNAYNDLKARYPKLPLPTIPPDEDVKKDWAAWDAKHKELDHTAEVAGVASSVLAYEKMPALRQHIHPIFHDAEKLAARTAERNEAMPVTEVMPVTGGIDIPVLRSMNEAYGGMGIFHPSVYKHLEGKNKEETLRNIEYEIKNKKAEHSFIVADNGKIHSAARGNDFSVPLFMDEKFSTGGRPGISNESFTFTHNHPVGEDVTLSAQDVAALRAHNIGTMRSVSPSGTTHEIKMKPGQNPTSRFVKRGIREALWASRKVIADGSNLDETAAAQGKAMHDFYSNPKYQRRYGFEYKRTIGERSGVKKNWSDYDSRRSNHGAQDAGAEVGGAAYLTHKSRQHERMSANAFNSSFDHAEEAKKHMAWAATATKRKQTGLAAIHMTMARGHQLASEGKAATAEKLFTRATRLHRAGRVALVAGAATAASVAYQHHQESV